MFTNFTSKVQSSKAVDRRDYELDEVLAILDMAENGVDREEISTITGRSKDSLNYKIFEKQTTINGKTSCRSILKHMYVDHKDKTKRDQFVTAEAFLRALYDSFKAKAPEGLEALEADVKARVEAYADAQDAKNNPVEAPAELDQTA